MCTNGKPKQRKYVKIMMDYNNPNDPWFNTGYDPYKGLNEKERIKVGCLQGAAFVVLIIMGLLLCAMLSGCTTTKYVQVPVVHNDTTIVTKHQRDSIWLHDSTYIKEKGDTVRIENGTRSMWKSRCMIPPTSQRWTPSARCSQTRWRSR
jgi:hypothetical protein